MIFFIFRGFLLVSAITQNPKTAHHGFPRILSPETSRANKPKEMTACITPLLAVRLVSVVGSRLQHQATPTDWDREWRKHGAEKTMLRRVLPAAEGSSCLCQGDAYSPSALAGQRPPLRQQSAVECWPPAHRELIDPCDTFWVQVGFFACGDVQI